MTTVVVVGREMGRVEAVIDTGLSGSIEPEDRVGSVRSLLPGSPPAA